MQIVECCICGTLLTPLHDSFGSRGQDKIIPFLSFINLNCKTRQILICIVCPEWKFTCHVLVGYRAFLKQLILGIHSLNAACQRSPISLHGFHLLNASHFSFPDQSNQPEQLFLQWDAKLLGDLFFFQKGTER